MVEAKGSVIFSISNKGDQRGEFIMVDRLRGQNHARGAVLQKEYVNPLYITVDPICSDCGEEPQWFQMCLNAETAIQALFGHQSQPLSVLGAEPGSMPALPTNTLF